MLPELEDSDWQEAFVYADNFCIEDVCCIVALEEGCNDSESWLGFFKLKDGRYAALDAWCDYTGWD